MKAPEAAPGGKAAAAAAAAGAQPTAAPAAAQPPVDTGPDPAVRQAFEQAYQALAAGRKREAERQFLALTRSNPELGGPHANLGLIYRQTGRGAEAVDELERAVNLGPQRAQYFDQLGIAYREQGQFDKARAAYERAIELDPNYAEPCLNLGILYDIYLWDGGRALEYYGRYLALQPSGDEKVTKWIADLRNRERNQGAVKGALSRREGS
ncbi:MAG TPA: tetratricopeptide repeat protein [Burkholderiaceae bacterium]